jgi:phage repressor protein C with HTH and peptisase S24 domain
MQGLSTISVLDSGLRFSHPLSMLGHHEIREELIRQLDAGEIRPKDVTAALGIPSSRVAEMRKRTRRIQPDELERMAGLLKMRDQPQPRDQAFGQGKMSGTAQPRPGPVLASGDVVQVQKLDLSLSMGPGTLIDDWVESEPVSFDLAFLRLVTRSPSDRLKLVTGIGDSMYPTLNWGDAILIDTTDRALARQDGIYWINLYGAAGIKRLRTVSRGRVLVVSDNPGVDDQEVDAGDLRIEGRAVWVARGL